MHHRAAQHGLIGLLLLLTPGLLLYAADDPPPAAPAVIEAREAAAHAGKTCTVAMTVESSRLLTDTDMGFLNSKRDYRDEDNFTVVMYDKALQKFKELGIDDPARHFRGKQIQVTGDVELRRGKPQIILEAPEKIRIIAPKASRDE
jgi:DNA/RNA endonuclease YhcR with UshA esterase domain